VSAGFLKLLLSEAPSRRAVEGPLEQSNVDCSRGWSRDPSTPLRFAQDETLGESLTRRLRRPEVDGYRLQEGIPLALRAPAQISPSLASESLPD
jgi:hypothetical protein